MKLLCVKPPDTMKIPRMSDVYFANAQVAEVGSESLIELVGVGVKESKTSALGTSSASPVTKVTVDNLSSETVNQDSEMKMRRDVRGDILGVHNETDSHKSVTHGPSASHALPEQWQYGGCP